MGTMYIFYSSRTIMNHINHTRTQRLRQDNFTAVHRGQETDRRREHPGLRRSPGLQTVRSPGAPGGLHAAGARPLRRVHHQGDLAVLRKVTLRQLGIVVFISISAAGYSICPQRKSDSEVTS